MLVVSVDGAGLRGSWNLDHVLVRVSTGGVHRIVVIKPPIEAPLLNPKLALASSSSSSWPLQVYRDASLADSPDAAVYFPCRQWFDKARGMAKQIFPMARTGQGSMLDYVVKVGRSRSRDPRIWSRE